MKRTWLILAILALAGCGQVPAHNRSYYLKHKSAMRKELDSAFCKSEMGRIHSDPAVFWKLLKTYNKKTKAFHDHRINNCYFAYQAKSYDAEMADPARMFGGPMNNNVMP